jgi:hypothetical protein
MPANKSSKPMTAGSHGQPRNDQRLVITSLTFADMPKEMLRNEPDFRQCLKVPSWLLFPATYMR